MKLSELMKAETRRRLYHALLQARRVAREAEEAFTAAILADSPYKVGQVIQSIQGGFVAKITEVRVVREKKVEISAVLRKKDGTWGKTLAPVWRDEWKNPIIVNEEVVL